MRHFILTTFVLLFVHQNIFASSLDSFDPTWTQTGLYPHSWLGYDVQPAGDFNCDGAPDFMFSAPIAGEPVSDGSRDRDWLGSVYLFFSDPVDGSLPDEPSLIIRGEKHAAFGMSLVSLGNLNPDEDDCDDIAVGSPAYRLVQTRGGPIQTHLSNVGAVTVFYGNNFNNAIEYSDSYSGDTWHVIHSDDTIGRGPFKRYKGDNSFFGQSLAAADVNGDNIKDLVVAAHFDDDDTNRLTNVGAVYVFVSKEGRFSPDQNAKAKTDADWSFLGTSRREHFGFVLATGNFNNDAYEDVVISSHRAYATNVYPKIEKVSVFLGSSSGLGQSALVKDNTIQNSSYLNPGPHNFGQTLTVADLNDDGYDDLVVGAPLFDFIWPYDETRLKGRVFIYEGADCTQSFSDTSVCKTSSDIFDAAQVLEGTQEFEVKGVSLANAGDINDDGCDDLLIGSTQQHSSGTRYVGAAHLHLGCSVLENGFLNTVPQWRFPVTALADAIPYNVNPYVNLQMGTGFRMQTPDREGKMQHSFSMANVGDVTGDGIDDILFGAYWFANFDDIDSTYRRFDRDFGKVFLFEGGVTFDDFQGAQVVSHDSETFSNNRESSSETFKPSCHGSSGSVNSVWFRFEATTQNVEATLRLDNTIGDTALQYPVMALWEYDPLSGEMNELECSIGLGTLDIGIHYTNLTSGHYYFVSIDNVYVPTQNFPGEFTLELSSELTSDSFLGAEIINLGEEVTGSNLNMSASTIKGTNAQNTNSITSACPYYSKQDVWYEIALEPTTADLEIQIFTESDSDFIHLSQASLWELDPQGDLTELTCGVPLYAYSDLGLSYSGVNARNRYFVSIDSYWAGNSTANAGEFQIVVTDELSNDSFAGALDLNNELNNLSGCISDNTLNGTTDGFRPTDWGTTLVNGTLWYRFTVSAQDSPKDIEIELNNDNVPTPALRLGFLALTDADQNPLLAIRGGTNTTELTYNNLAAGDYYIAVANVVNAEGHFNLCLD